MLVDDIFPLGITTAIDSMLGLSYSIVFVLSTRDRAKAMKAFTIVLVVTAVIVLYAALAWAGCTDQSCVDAASVLGYIVAASAIAFYLSPLAKLRTVLRTKSAGAIPIAMVAVGALNNALWLTYAVIVKDNFIMVPNVVCLTFNTIQVLLYIKYNPKRSMEKPSGTSDEMIVVVHETLGSSPLHSSTFHTLS